MFRRDFPDVVGVLKRNVWCSGGTGGAPVDGRARAKEGPPSGKNALPTGGRGVVDRADRGGDRPGFRQAAGSLTGPGVESGRLPWDGPKGVS